MISMRRFLLALVGSAGGRCWIEIDGTCDAYPSMSNRSWLAQYPRDPVPTRSWFDDRKHGGAGDAGGCAARVASWQRSCGPRAVARSHAQAALARRVAPAVALAETLAFPLPARGRWVVADAAADDDQARPCNPALSADGVKFACNRRGAPPSASSTAPPPRRAAHYLSLIHI